MIKAIAFDWGNTIMREIPLSRRPSAHSASVEVVPGVNNALQVLTRQYLCCIASNARGPESTALGLVLERVGLEKYFRQIFTAEDLKAQKPDARFFQGLVQQLKFQPNECVMVGDDYQADIIGAKHAGMRTVWFTEHVQQDAPYADVVITAMDQLAPAIAKLNALRERITA